MVKAKPGHGFIYRFIKELIHPVDFNYYKYGVIRVAVKKVAPNLSKLRLRYLKMIKTPEGNS